MLWRDEGEWTDLDHGAALSIQHCIMIAYRRKRWSLYCSLISVLKLFINKVMAQINVLVYFESTLSVLMTMFS